jgi:hypothetical protein
MQYRFNEAEHLHEGFNGIEWKPLTGTSTICKVIAKPLTWWASGLACAELGWVKKLDTRKKPTEEELLLNERARFEKAELMLGLYKQMSVEEYIKLLDKAYKAHDKSLDKSASAGTDLHAELEKFVKSRMGKNTETVFDPKITPFIEWADKNVKKFIASEANCYSERLWVGGITDCVAELNDGSLAVIDFKSSKEAYKNHFIQAAGYAIQLEESGMCDQTGTYCKDIPGKITQLIVVPFGAARVSPVVMRGVDEYKKAFEAAVVLYRLIENYEE